MKNRLNPDKAQNKWGGDYDCPAYDKDSDICHEPFLAGFNKTEWANKKEGFLNCKGNRHICLKIKRKWLASNNYS